MHWYNKYRKNVKPPRQDNKTYYSNRRGRYDKMVYPEFCSIRIPSLKRGKSTWKRFYKLFPKLKYMNNYYGTKLKNI